MKSIKMWAPIFALTLLLFAGCGGHKSGRNGKKTLSSNVSSQVNFSPAALRGKKIASHKGCMNCHTINGKSMTGPTLKNLYDHKTTLKNGSTIIADSSYIIQSLKQPSAKVVAGFFPVMPKYDFLPEQKIKDLVAYIKALSDVHSGK